MNKIEQEFKETLRALDLIDFLGHLDKDKTVLIVEFLDIKPEKMQSINRAFKAKEETQKTLMKSLGIEEGN